MSNLFTWQVHGDGKTLKPGEVVEPDERLTWPRTAEIGAQHVIAMFGATFLVPILTGFDPSTTLFFTAMSTALFQLINKNMLPSYLGSSFGFIAPIAAVASAHKGLAVASFGIMVTGILLALIGVLVHYAGAKWIDIIMPPVVNGAIVAIIGFNLAPSVWNNFKVAPDTAIVTLVAVLLVAVLFKGLLGRLNILIGVIIGYAYSCFRCQVDFSAIGKAAWIGLPEFRLPQVDFTILPMFIPVVLVLIAENVGHVKSVSQMTGRDYDDEIGTALFADGLGTTIAGFGGGSGTNIVSESCLVEGEIRSLNHETAMELLATYQKTFQQEADAIGAKLVWEEKLNIHAYETPLTGVAAKHYESAVAKEGLTAAFEKTFGGSDNNVFAQHGIEGLVIATSMNQVHSCAEYTKIPEIAQVARIVANLAAL